MLNKTGGFSFSDFFNINFGFTRTSSKTLDRTPSVTVRFKALRESQSTPIPTDTSADIRARAMTSRAMGKFSKTEKNIYRNLVTKTQKKDINEGVEDTDHGLMVSQWVLEAGNIHAVSMATILPFFSATHALAVFISTTKTVYNKLNTNKLSSTIKKLEVSSELTELKDLTLQKEEQYRSIHSSLIAKQIVDCVLSVNIFSLSIAVAAGAVATSSMGIAVAIGVPLALGAYTAYTAYNYLDRPERFKAVFTQDIDLVKQKMVLSHLNAIKWERKNIGAIERHIRSVVSISTSSNIARVPRYVTHQAIKAKQLEGRIAQVKDNIDVRKRNIGEANLNDFTHYMAKQNPETEKHANSWNQKIPNKYDRIPYNNSYHEKITNAVNTIVQQKENLKPEDSFFLREVLKIDMNDIHMGEKEKIAQKINDYFSQGKTDFIENAVAFNNRKEMFLSEDVCSFIKDKYITSDRKNVLLNTINEVCTHQGIPLSEGFETLLKDARDAAAKQLQNSSKTSDSVISLTPSQEVAIMDLISQLSSKDAGAIALKIVSHQLHRK